MVHRGIFGMLGLGLAEQAEFHPNLYFIFLRSMIMFRAPIMESNSAARIRIIGANMEALQEQQQLAQ